MNAINEGEGSGRGMGDNNNMYTTKGKMSKGRENIVQIRKHTHALAVQLQGGDAEVARKQAEQLETLSRPSH